MVQGYAALDDETDENQNPSEDKKAVVPPPRKGFARKVNVPSVTSYHAQIGHNVDKSTLEKLENSLLLEAKLKFDEKKYEEALELFTHCRAITEKIHGLEDTIPLAAIIHNIGS